MNSPCYNQVIRMRLVNHPGFSAIGDNTQLDEDITYFYEELSRVYPWFEGLNLARKCVLIDMSFSLGIKKLVEFTRMLEALAVGDFDIASAEMLSSLWAVHLGERALALAKIMWDGE